MYIKESAKAKIRIIKYHFIKKIQAKYKCKIIELFGDFNL